MSQITVRRPRWNAATTPTYWSRTDSVLQNQSAVCVKSIVPRSSSRRLGRFLKCAGCCRLKVRSSCGKGVEMAGTLLLARLLQLNAGFPVRTDASLALQPIKSREESEETGAACASDVTDPPLKLTRTQSGGMERGQRALH